MSICKIRKYRKVGFTVLDSSIRMYQSKKKNAVPYSQFQTHKEKTRKFYIYKIFIRFSVYEFDFTGRRRLEMICMRIGPDSRDASARGLPHLHRWNPQAGPDIRLEHTLTDGIRTSTRAGTDIRLEHKLIDPGFT